MAILPWQPLLAGLMLGLAIAAPPGPVGLLCMSRTLAHGARHGLATGLGAALADAGYGVLVALGATALADLLTAHAAELRLIGGFLLMLLGASQLASAAAVCAGARAAPRHGSALLSALALTLTNPMTILAFVVALAAFGQSGAATGGGGAWALVVGVLLGSMLWWCLLVALVVWLGRLLSMAAQRRIRQLSALALMALGGAVLLG
ncbi:LysE family translocator [Marichromatium bheemlicum]|uniref:LysE family transporter n=1 Tax=Marichromatium bheemlicum TaxID=365339 RepID=A0ABX1IB40_9GAMM|nr:LysE family transporter [Marichromatium bheemlicum]NKN34473.1 LysE family transporter [Marichromatium bheemlicum]